MKEYKKRSSKKSRNAMRLSVINSIAIVLLFVAFLILR